MKKIIGRRMFLGAAVVMAGLLASEWVVHALTGLRERAAAAMTLYYPNEGGIPAEPAVAASAVMGQDKHIMAGLPDPEPAAPLAAAATNEAVDQAGLGRRDAREPEHQSKVAWGTRMDDEIAETLRVLYKE